MKKKIMAMCLVIAMAATAVIGGTLAYFTDTDAETNVFTMGGVEIDLIENEFDKEGALVDYVNENKNLMPGTQTQNKLDKIVSIKNTGDSNAYVWYEWLIPAALDSVEGDTGLTNVLHINNYGATWDKYIDKGYALPDVFKAAPYIQVSADAAWDHDPEVETGIAVGPEGYIRKETIGEVEYNVYLVLFTGEVAPDQVTAPAMNGLYLDKDLDFNGENYVCHGGEVEFDFEEGINIPVRAFAIQAEGFANVYEAFAAYNAQN